MSSFVIGEAFRYMKNSGIKNAISQRFLCNSSRFSKIIEESDYEKNLLIVDRNCPKDATKYYRRLSAIRINHIITNCIQLISLTLDVIDQCDVWKLPRTLHNLKIYNSSNITCFNGFPRNLKSLTMFCFSSNVDMNYLPNLERLEIGGCGFYPKFINSENHELRSLTLKNTIVQNCNFQRLFYFETNAEMNIYNLSQSSRDKIAEMKIPVDFNLANFKFIGLLKLVLTRGSCMNSFIDTSRIINLHQSFPNLEIFEVEKHATLKNKFSFNHKMEQVISNLICVDESVESDYFSLTCSLNSKIPIHQNILSSKGKILIKNSDGFHHIYFEFGKIDIEENFHSRLYNIQFRNNTLYYEKI